MPRTPRWWTRWVLCDARVHISGHVRPDRLVDPWHKWIVIIMGERVPLVHSSTNHHFNVRIAAWRR